MDEFKKVTTIDQLSPGRCMSAVLDGQYVALFNVDGVVHALAGNCPHMGGLLGNGTLTGSVVKCPEHGMRFDVATGATPGGGGMRIKKYAVKVENADVLVSLADDTES